jgi:Aerotolerance regulator N-terminal
MNFLQPWLLFGLPLLLLPIIIHLINQWRYQTKRWGAMMFLLAANRMARGYAKIRQYLILAMRMLAIAGLIFAISRPLASGLLGFSGGRPDTTIVLLDRSPSMQQRSDTSAASKLETAKLQLRQTLQTLGSNHWVLIDSANGQPREFDKASDLFDAPDAQPAHASANLPDMLQTTLEYLQKNRPGQTEVWICSDQRQSDWSTTSNQWTVVRDAFRQFPQSVRFHLLSYPEATAENLSVRVTDVHRDRTEGSQELVMSLLLSRPEGSSTTKNVPVQIEVNGARSEITAEMTGSTVEIKDHRVPFDPSQSKGWGRVTIPADTNLLDNEYYFVFDQPPPRRSVVIGEDPDSASPLALAAGISPDPQWKADVVRGTTDQLASMDLDTAGLLIWQGALPTGPAAQIVSDFVGRGGRVLFFPPTSEGDSDTGPGYGPNSNEFMGIRWSGWKASEKVMVENWRGDQDLLAATRSGSSLPVGQIELRGHATVSGDSSVLASLSGGDPLFVKATTENGGVYFCTASVSSKYSNLARSGIVLYVVIQRALDKGLESLGNTRDFVAGDSDAKGLSNAWTKVAGSDDILSTEFAVQSGIYQDGDRLIAINRSLQEDQTDVVQDSQLDELFAGLNFARVESKAGNVASIVREIWRIFLILMIIAMITEAAMCLPKWVRPQGALA